VGGCCASGACQDQHNNGVGGNYYDCTTPGTYDQTQAEEAANSDTAQAGSLVNGTCGSGSNVAQIECKTAGSGSTGTCTCWTYAATGNLVDTVGYLYVNTIATGENSGCYCPANTSNPTWN
jgi:hypothetical protein